MRAMVAVLAVIVVSGCASTAISGPSMPVPTVSPTTDAAEERLALVEEAKAVYRRQYAESKRLVLAGGVTDPTPTPEIEATMADPSKTDYMLLMKDIKDQGIKAVSLEWKLTMRESAELVGDGALVSLESCEDSRGSVFVDKDGASLGETTELVYYTWGFKRDGGALKMFASDAEMMTSCPLD